MLPSEAAMRDHWRGRRGHNLPKQLQLPTRPDGESWDELTLAWWQEAITSPMGTRFLAADVAGLRFAFVLVDEFYREWRQGPSRGWHGRLQILAVEVRQQIARFGLSPRDRLALHWGVAEDEELQPAGGDGPKPRNVSDIRSVLGEEKTA